jgi:spermidine synthase
MWQHPLGTDKEWPHTFLSGLYSRKFIKEHQVQSILEIGLANGASLALWAQAFPEAEIVGVDINECRTPHPALRASNRLTMFRADAYSPEFIKSLNRRFDVIIDDGPHTVVSQIKAVQLYSKLLNKDGLLVIEDVAKGLVTARAIRKACEKKIRRNLVYYDFRKMRNHFDNCLVVYFDNPDEAAAEWNRQSLWSRFTFIAPLKLPSEIAINFYSRRLYFGIRYRICMIFGKIRG